MSGTFARNTKPTHKSQPCKRAYLVPTLPGHTLPRWTQTFNSSYQDEGRTHNAGLAKCGRTVLKLGIGNSIWLLYLNGRTQPRMPALRQAGERYLLF